jgi:threonyl-tRNA synthetase
VRLAQTEKVSYVIVVGKKEIEAGMLAVRLRNGNTVKHTHEEFLKRIRLECEKRVDGLVDGTLPIEQFEEDKWTFRP